MKKRRLVALCMATMMAMSGMTGCGASDSGASSTEAKPEASSEGASEVASTGETQVDTIDVKSLPAGSVDISIMLPLGQWTDNFDSLITAYKEEHPEIGEITATLKA